MEEQAPSPTLLVRVAGLPIAAATALHSDALAQQVDAITILEKALGTARQSLVDMLFQVVSDAPPKQRRKLLTVKRDCFNGRSLRRYRERPIWEDIRQSCGSAADDVVQLEDQLEACREELEASYGAERQRAVEALIEWMEHPGLLRGLALSSPTFVETLRKLSAAPNALRARKRRKFEFSLLRYVSRAALKLSPYSTLTRVALGTTQELPSTSTLTLLGSEWQEHSLLRVRRYMLDQIVTALGHHPVPRADWSVVLNCTAEATGGGGYRFLRPDAWEPDAELGHPRYRAQSLASIKLTGPLVDWLWKQLPLRSHTYGQLLGHLADELPSDPAEVGAVVDRLVELGFLELRPLWPSNIGHLEAAIWESLRTLPSADDTLTDVVANLQKLVALEKRFPASTQPERTADEIDRQLDKIWQSLAFPADSRGALQLKRGRPRDVYEDVFLTSEHEEGLVQLPRSTANRLVSHLDPWIQLANLQGYRFDFLHTVAGFMDQNWPKAQEITIFELFSAIQPLWRQFRKFEAETPLSESWHRSFNPLDLESIEQLRQVKETLWSEVGQLLDQPAGSQHLAPEDLVACLEKLPPEYDSPFGACLFLQPADAVGGLWVLNRTFEGTGRYASRFTAAMDPATRRRYTEAMRHASTVDTAEGPAQLLDLMWSRGDTLNIHAAQTRWTLAVPGLTPDPSAQQLSVQDLRVTVGPKTGLPQLIGPSGQRFIPVYLGGAAMTFLPPWLQFMALWGPWEVRNFHLPGIWRDEDELRVCDRLTLGDVVVRRKRWVASASDVKKRIDDRSPDDAFIELRRWLREHGIPDQVFLIERLHREGFDGFHKPQYLDLTAPLFVELLQTTVQSSDKVIFEEMLPLPDASVPDAGGVHWAVELGLDTLALS